MLTWQVTVFSLSPLDYVFNFQIGLSANAQIFELFNLTN